jgi:hypothetical protein
MQTLVSRWHTQRRICSICCRVCASGNQSGFPTEIASELPGVSTPHRFLFARRILSTVPTKIPLQCARSTTLLVSLLAPDRLTIPRKAHSCTSVRVIDCRSLRFSPLSANEVKGISTRQGIYSQQSETIAISTSYQVAIKDGF